MHIQTDTVVGTKLLKAAAGNGDLLIVSELIPIWSIGQC